MEYIEYTSPVQPLAASRPETFREAAPAGGASWTKLLQDDRRPPAPLRQHRCLPLRLPHLPHLLAGATAMEEEVSEACMAQLFVAAMLASQPIWGHVMAESPLLQPPNFSQNMAKSSHL